MNREDQAVSVAAWLGESLALVAISALVLAWMVPAVDRRLPPARKEPLWLPQLAFVALATFLLCTLVVPALIVRAFGASDGAPSPELGTFATAVANLLAIGLTLVVARRRFDATAADVALARPRPLALAFGALAIVAAFPAFLGISFVNLRLTEALGLEPHQALVRTLLDDREFLSRPWVLASIVLVVPFCEELLFRGLLQRALRVAMPAAPARMAAPSQPTVLRRV